MHPLHYAAMIEITNSIDEREMFHRIELYHARVHEQRKARRARRRKILDWARTMRPAPAVADVAALPR